MAQFQGFHNVLSDLYNYPVQCMTSAACFKWQQWLKFQDFLIRTVKFWINFFMFHNNLIFTVSAALASFYYISYVFFFCILILSLIMLNNETNCIKIIINYRWLKFHSLKKFYCIHFILILLITHLVLTFFHLSMWLLLRSLTAGALSRS